MSKLRYLVLSLLLAGAVGCGVVSSTVPPGPEAVNAASLLASDISAYRTSTDTLRGGRDAAAGYELTLFARVYDRVRADYVREVDGNVLLAAASEGMREAFPDPAGVDDHQLIEAAINAMLVSLDPYSVYLNREALAAVRDQTRGEFGGLGIEVRKGDEYIEVVTPIDHTPAARAGIKPEDRIIRADGESLAGMALREAVLKLRGPAGSDITLTVGRKGRQPFDLTLTREIIHIHAVRWHLEGDVGYIRIASFSEGTTEQLIEAVGAIQAQRGADLKGLVIDLRNNPGGLFEESITASDSFLDNGIIVSTRSRSAERRYAARPGDVLNGKPIVVLTNNGSASAAEILAGALKDLKRATIVGTRSYGKGSVQTIMPLSRQDALKLTTALYHTPSGKSVEGGIRPDILVEDNERTEADEQLARALQEVRHSYAEAHVTAHR